MAQQISTQRTYRGETGSAILGRAAIEQMRAGNWEIVTTLPLHGACVIDQDQDGDMVVRDSHGLVACLVMSRRGQDALAVLCGKREASYTSTVEG